MNWDKQKIWDDTVQISIADGDFHRALEALVCGYQHVVIGFCINILGDVDLGEEVAQEVFLALYKAMPQFRQQASIRTWLFAIARKQCLKALRDRDRKIRKNSANQEAIAEATHAEQQKTPEEGLLEEERLRRLKHGLSKLGEKERALLLMRYDTGLSIAEIAHIFGISVPRVYGRLAQALQQLRRVVDR